jgi:hypothetical protein
MAENNKLHSQTQNRDFKGVWIPKEIWLDKNLSWSEKNLLVEIDSLAKNNSCFATNEYLAEFFSLSKDRISKLITSLKNKGYVEVNLIYKDGTKQIEKRIITTIGYRRKQLEGIGENNYTPIGENNEDINTNNINTIINTKRGGEERTPPTPENKKNLKTENKNQIDNTQKSNTDNSSKKEIQKNKNTNYQSIVDEFNKICISFPKVQIINQTRKKSIQSRLNSGYTIEKFTTLFEKAQTSGFLKGENDRNWTATFDWLINETNMTKVLEGNYDNKANTYTKNKPVDPRYDTNKVYTEWNWEKDDNEPVNTYGKDYNESWD